MTRWFKTCGGCSCEVEVTEVVEFALFDLEADRDRWKADADRLAAATRRALQEYDRYTARQLALRAALDAHDALTAETESK